MWDSHLFDGMLIVCAMKYMFFGRIQDKNEFAAYVRADLRAGSKSKWHFSAWATPAEWKSSYYADAKSGCP